MNAAFAWLRAAWRRLLPPPERPELARLAETLRAEIGAFRSSLAPLRDAAGRVGHALELHRASLRATRSALESVSLDVKLALERASSTSRDLVHRIDSLGAILQADADAPRRLADRASRMRRRALTLCITATVFLLVGAATLAIALALLTHRGP